MELFHQFPECHPDSVMNLCIINHHFLCPKLAIAPPPYALTGLRAEAIGNFFMN